MPAVYILQSEKTSRFYIGCATEVLVRLTQHQRGQTISTRGRGPWVLVYQERFETLAEARRRERQLKSWKSHRSILKLIIDRRSEHEKMSASRLAGKVVGSIPTRSTNRSTT